MSILGLVACWRQVCTEYDVDQDAESMSDSDYM